jgi:hypothetical protein
MVYAVYRLLDFCPTSLFCGKKPTFQNYLSVPPSGSQENPTEVRGLVGSMGLHRGTVQGVGAYGVNQSGRGVVRCVLIGSNRD